MSTVVPTIERVDCLPSSVAIEVDWVSSGDFVATAAAPVAVVSTFMKAVTMAELGVGGNEVSSKLFWLVLLTWKLKLS